jgi:hypothetical protein
MGVGERMREKFLLTGGEIERQAGREQERCGCECCCDGGVWLSFVVDSTLVAWKRGIW